MSAQQSVFVYVGFSGILSLIIEIVVTLFLTFLLTFYCPAQYVRRLRTHGVGASYAWSCMLNILQSIVWISADCCYEKCYILL